MAKAPFGVFAQRIALNGELGVLIDALHEAGIGPGEIIVAAKKKEKELAGEMTGGMAAKKPANF